MQAGLCGRTGCLTSCVLFETWSPLETKGFSFSGVCASCKLLLLLEDLCGLEACLTQEQGSQQSLSDAAKVMRWLHWFCYSRQQIKLGGTASPGSCCPCYIFRLSAFDMLSSFSCPLACMPPECMSFLELVLLTAHLPSNSFPNYSEASMESVCNFLQFQLKLKLCCSESGLISGILFVLRVSFLHI